MHRNRHGLAVTAASQDAVDAYDRLTDHFFQYSRATGDALNAALAHDPDMVLAHCIKGYFLNLMADAAARDQAAGARRHLAGSAGGRGLGLRGKPLGSCDRVKTKTQSCVFPAVNFGTHGRHREEFK